MSNSFRESINGEKPHSYAVNFSASSCLTERRKLRKKIITDNTTQKIIKIKILK
jgi:hypothetical protein